MMLNQLLRIFRVLSFFRVESLFACIVFVFLFPIIFLIFILLLFFERQNPIFVQYRVGFGREKFKIFKFRTMSENISSTENNYSLSYDEIYQKQTQRVTLIGSFLRRTSLDELLQLLNIINGTMAFVGPRPILLKQLEAIPRNFECRHDVLPGVTGLAQVKGRRSLGWLSQLRYDKFYVDKKSFLFDVKIILLTIKSVVTSDGVEPTKGKNWRSYLK